MHKCPVCKQVWKCEMGEACSDYPHIIGKPTLTMCSTICIKKECFVTEIKGAKL